MSGGDALPIDSWKVIVSSVLLMICIGGIIGNCCVIVVFRRVLTVLEKQNLQLHLL